jgi:hypothetical protein
LQQCMVHIEFLCHHNIFGTLIMLQWLREEASFFLEWLPWPFTKGTI